MVAQSAHNRRRILFTALILVGCLLLAGCTPSMEPIDENAEGWFDRYFIYNFSRLLLYFGELFGGNYGLSVIVVTLLVRLALTPLMKRQFFQQRRMQEKMKIVQPKLLAIQEKYKNRKDPDSQKKMQMEMMQVYQEHQFNPLAIGCLPLLIQFPILVGFYYAILRTPEIAAHEFLWFNLGEADMVMALIAAGSYFVQLKASQAMYSPSQQTRTNQNQQGDQADKANQMNAQMKILNYFFPIMIGVISIYSPAVLPLYWTVGALFLMAQNWLFHWLYQRQNAKKAANGEGQS